MDPTNYFETHNIDQHGPDPEPGLRHAGRQDQDRPCQGREALAATTSPRSMPTSATRMRSKATPSAASARSSCRRPGLGALNYDLYLQAAGREAPEHPDHHRASGRGRRAARQEVPRRQVRGERALSRSGGAHARRLYAQDSHGQLLGRPAAGASRRAGRCRSSPACG